MTGRLSQDFTEPLHGRVSADRVAALTGRLIRCDTSNPPGNEQSIIQLLVDTLTRIDCAVEVFERTPGRPSVVARSGPADGARPVLLINGHIDVVPVRRAEWSIEPFAGVVQDGRVRGRGACDMKGGIAAAIEALTVCREANLTLDADIVLHLVADEETGGSHGTEALAEAGLIRADACIIPEPNDMHVGIAERGTLIADIVVDGRAAHGSDPAAGHSAVADAARIVQALHLADFGDPDHPVLGRPTCNVGTIAGGTSANVVASECTVRIDRRVLPGHSQDKVLKSIKAKLGALDPKVEYRIHPRMFVEASEIDSEAPFVHYFRQVALGRSGPAEIGGSYLGSDARILRNRLGIPTVVYGPGSMRHAHTADEWVAIDDLVKVARSLVSVFTTFGSHPLLGRAGDGTILA